MAAMRTDKRDQEKLAALEGTQMADGHYRAADGTKLFYDDLTPVGGVN